MQSQIVTLDEGKAVLIPENLLTQAGLMKEVILEVTEEGLLIRPRTLPFEEALQQVMTDHNDILRSLAQR